MAPKETFDTEITPLYEAGDKRFTKLMTSLHEAQAQGVLRDETAICRLMTGIEQALSNTIEGNARDPKAAWALQTDVYWDYFEMDIKENLLRAFSGLDPELRRIVRQTVDETLSSLKREYWSA